MTGVAIKEIERRALAHIRPSIYETVIDGTIVVIRNVPELHALRDLLAETLCASVGQRAGDELLKWCNEAQAPSATTVAHIANIMLRMRRSYVLPTLMADFCRELGFPDPVLLECGAPRFNVPESIEKQFLSAIETLNPEVLEAGKNDPMFDHMLVKRHYPHRDIGRPQLAFQANAWCALQELKADESNLLLFPDAFRDIRHDRSYYAFNDDPDPARWGLGTPVIIPLRFGDIVFFNGDLFHSSPRDTGNNLRLSWEMRIIGRCHDDRGWYRFGHLSLNDFLPLSDSKKEPEGAIARGLRLWRDSSDPPASPLSYLATRESTATAMQVLNWLMTNPEASKDALAESVEAMKRFPFAEDRFLWPLFLAQQKYPDSGIDRDIQEYVISSSANYYWLLVYGGLALATSRNALADRAFGRAREAARRVRADTSTNPVDYFHALSEGKSWLMPVIYEITPEDVDEVIRLYKEGAVTRGCRGDSVELVPGFPFVKGMFRLYYPYVQFHPPSKHVSRGGPSSLFDRIARHLPVRFQTGAPKKRIPARSLQVGETWLPF